MRAFVLVPLLLAALTSGMLAENTPVRTAGDIGQIAIPVTGLIVSLVADDVPNGMGSELRALALTLGATYALKFAVDRERPNGSGHSFPSAHTAAAFSGASYLHRRYGLRFGIPAYAAAAFVGYSRVDAKRHHVSDVLAGAVLGIVPNLLLTERFRRHVCVEPLVSRERRGVSVTVSF